MVPGYSWNNSYHDYINSVWEYDPQNNSWTQKVDYPGSERQFGFAIGTGNRAYLGLGHDERGNQLNDIFEYDPLEDCWKQISNYPGKGSDELASLYIYGNLYIGMGTNGSYTYADFWKLDLIDMSWKQMSSCPLNIASAVSHVIGNKGLIGYGWYNLREDDDEVFGRRFFEFDPAKN